MKIKCEVLSVETNGDDLVVRAQGEVKGAASWRPYSVVKFDVPDIAVNRKALYVGRKFNLSIDLLP